MSSGSLAIMQIAQLKSTQANNTALDAAEKQRELINKQRDLRQAQSTFERLVDDGNLSVSDAQAIEALEDTTGMDIDGLDSATYMRSRWVRTGFLSWQRREELAARGPTGNLRADGEDPSDSQIRAADEVKEHVDGMRKKFDDAIKDLEAEDRLGNHEIQRLMQIMNQNDTLAANVSKKDDDRANAVIGKI